MQLQDWMVGFRMAMNQFLQKSYVGFQSQHFTISICGKHENTPNTIFSHFVI